MMTSRRTAYRILRLKKFKIHRGFFNGGFSVGDEKHVGGVRYIYEKWLNNPKTVSPVWDSFFRTVSQHERSKCSKSSGPEPVGSVTKKDKMAGESKEEINLEDIFLVQQLIRSYQVRGHHFAELNRPNRSEKVTGYEAEHKSLLKKVKNQLKPENNFELQSLITHIHGNESRLSLLEIIDRLENVYCNSIGLEYMHISSFEQCDYLRRQFETPNAFKFSEDEKRLLITRLTRTVCFEKFLNSYCSKVDCTKSLEGCEVLIPSIKTIIDESTNRDIDHFVFGMCQKGRLNVLANIFGVSLKQLMALLQNSYLGTDQVKLNTNTNKKTRLTMMIGPPDMNIIAPITLGRSKIEQFIKLGNHVLPILIHDSSDILRSGIFNISTLSGFDTGGTIHIVLNNELFNFESKAFRAFSNLAKSIDAPIFHVNADDPEAVQRVSKVAADWRHTFKKDIIINLMPCNRNVEITSDLTVSKPLKMKGRRNVLQKYFDQLRKDGTIDEKEMIEYTKTYKKLLMTAFEQSKDKNLFIGAWIDTPKLTGFNRLADIPPTGLEENELLSIGNLNCSIPPDFSVHKDVAKKLEHRSSLLNQKIVSWSLAEAIALGSLLKIGVHVRLSGSIQDNMWKHRQYVLHHEKKDISYTPIDIVDPAQSKFTIHHHSSSEEAVLGFEIGYSQCDPNVLVIWNAKDDGLNIPQSVFDEYLACGIDKWKKPTGIVLNLPHGRHSAKSTKLIRPERFLQLCADDEELDYRKQLFNCNWIIAYPTTPANFFHVLRRQAMMSFRRPLINILPRNLIESEENHSKFEEFGPETNFQRIITEDVDPKNIDTVVFCCGKIYYDLAAMRETEQIKNVTFIRIEQIYPFPYDLLRKEILKYPKAKFIFAQEEPKNMGFQGYCVPKLKIVMKELKLKVITTPASLHPDTDVVEDVVNYEKMKMDVIAEARKNFNGEKNKDLTRSEDSITHKSKKDDMSKDTATTLDERYISQFSSSHDEDDDDDEIFKTRNEIYVTEPKVNDLTKFAAKADLVQKIINEKNPKDKLAQSKIFRACAQNYLDYIRSKDRAAQKVVTKTLAQKSKDAINAGVLKTGIFGKTTPHGDATSAEVKATQDHGASTRGSQGNVSQKYNDRNVAQSCIQNSTQGGSEGKDADVNLIRGGDDMSSQYHTLQDKDARQSQVNATQYNTTQATFQVSASQVGTSQVGTAQLGATQVGASQVGASQVSASQVDASQVNASQVNTPQVSTPQASTSQASTSQENISQGNLSQGNMSQGNMSQGNMSQENITQVHPLPGTCQGKQTQVNTTNTDISQMKQDHKSTADMNFIYNVYQGETENISQDKSQAKSSLLTCAQSNITQGNMTQGNMTQGNITQGNIAQGNVIQDNVTQSNMTQGNTTQSNAGLGVANLTHSTTQANTFQSNEAQNNINQTTTIQNKMNQSYGDKAKEQFIQNQTADNTLNAQANRAQDIGTRIFDGTKNLQLNLSHSLAKDAQIIGTDAANIQANLAQINQMISSGILQVDTQQKNIDGAKSNQLTFSKHPTGQVAHNPSSSIQVKEAQVNWNENETNVLCHATQGTDSQTRINQGGAVEFASNSNEVDTSKSMRKFKFNGAPNDGTNVQDTMQNTQTKTQVNWNQIKDTQLKVQSKYQAADTMRNAQSANQNNASKMSSDQNLRHSQSINNTSNTSYQDLNTQVNSQTNIPQTNISQTNISEANIPQINIPQTNISQSTNINAHVNMGTSTPQINSSQFGLMSNTPSANTDLNKPVTNQMTTQNNIQGYDQNTQMNFQNTQTPEMSQENSNSAAFVSTQNEAQSSQNINTQSQNINNQYQNINTQSQNINTQSQNINTQSQNVNTQPQNINTQSQNINTQFQNTQGDQIASQNNIGQPINVFRNYPLDQNNFQTHTRRSIPKFEFKAPQDINNQDHLKQSGNAEMTTQSNQFNHVNCPQANSTEMKIEPRKVTLRDVFEAVSSYTKASQAISFPSTGVTHTQGYQGNTPHGPTQTGNIQNYPASYYDPNISHNYNAPNVASQNISQINCARYNDTQGGNLQGNNTPGHDWTFDNDQSSFTDHTDFSQSNFQGSQNQNQNESYQIQMIPVKNDDAQNSTQYGYNYDQSNNENFSKSSNTEWNVAQNNHVNYGTGETQNTSPYLNNQNNWNITHISTQDNATNDAMTQNYTDFAQTRNDQDNFLQYTDNPSYTDYNTTQSTQNVYTQSSENIYNQSNENNYNQNNDYQTNFDDQGNVWNNTQYNQANVSQANDAVNAESFENSTYAPTYGVDQTNYSQNYNTGFNSTQSTDDYTHMSAMESNVDNVPTYPTYNQESTQIVAPSNMTLRDVVEALAIQKPAQTNFDSHETPESNSPQIKNPQWNIAERNTAQAVYTQTYGGNFDQSNSHWRSTNDSRHNESYGNENVSRANDFYESSQYSLQNDLSKSNKESLYESTHYGYTNEDGNQIYDNKPNVNWSTQNEDHTYQAFDAQSHRDQGDSKNLNLGVSQVFDTQSFTKAHGDDFRGNQSHLAYTDESNVEGDESDEIESQSNQSSKNVAARNVTLRDVVEALATQKGNQTMSRMSHDENPESGETQGNFGEIKNSQWDVAQRNATQAVYTQTYSGQNQQEWNVANTGDAQDFDSKVYSKDDSRNYDSKGYDSKEYNSNVYSSKYDSKHYDSNVYHLKDDSTYASNDYNLQGYDSKAYNLNAYDSKNDNSKNYDSINYESKNYDSTNYDSTNYDSKNYESKTYDSKTYDSTNYDSKTDDSKVFHSNDYDLKNYDSQIYSSQNDDLSNNESKSYDSTNYDSKTYDSQDNSTIYNIASYGYSKAFKIQTDDTQDNQSDGLYNTRYESETGTTQINAPEMASYSNELAYAKSDSYNDQEVNTTQTLNDVSYTHNDQSAKQMNLVQSSSTDSNDPGINQEDTQNTQNDFSPGSEKYFEHKLGIQNDQMNFFQSTGRGNDQGNLTQISFTQDNGVRVSQVSDVQHNVQGDVQVNFRQCDNPRSCVVECYRIGDNDSRDKRFNVTGKNDIQNTSTQSFNSAKDETSSQNDTQSGDGRAYTTQTGDQSSLGRCNVQVNYTQRKPGRDVERRDADDDNFVLS